MPSATSVVNLYYYSIFEGPLSLANCIDKRHTRHYIYFVVFNWDEGKNEWLKKYRHISFEQIVIDIENGDILDVLKNPGKIYRNQILIVVNHNGYAYAIPAVKSQEEYFLKTIFPSRKYTYKYIKQGGG